MSDTAVSSGTRAATAGLLDQLLQLRRAVEADANALLDRWGLEPGEADFSIRNMARYVALRRNDLRSLQRDLVPLGLSSLGRLEGHVMETLDAVARSLAIILGRDEDPEIAAYPPPEAFAAGEQRLRERAAALFGPPPAGDEVCVMVTIDPIFNGTAEAIAPLIARGATVFRINGAHDTRREWQQLIDAVHQAERHTGQRCFILFDLAGPKIRTTDVIAPGEKHRVQPGDVLLLHDGEPMPIAEWPVQFGSSIPGLAGSLTEGSHVLIDDGHLDSVVEQLLPGAAVLRVLRTRRKGERLKRDRGLNIPGVDLPVEPLTAKDLEDLNFAAPAVDMVGLSFVREPSDITHLQREIAARCAPPEAPAIVAKIESPRAFRMLPGIVVRGSTGPFGVMIARGDLAVEAGFERLAEVQEEMLWLCEAAHLPAIWATQVLEGLSRDGTYSRAEITDAAMSARAECVMLNKGEHVPEAVAALSDLLRRMAGHQRKKSAQLRALRAW